MGRVAAPYGVKGWLKILPLTSAPETLLTHTRWWMRRRGGDGPWQPHALVSGRQHGATLLAQLSGLCDREAAAQWSGGDVGVEKSTLPPAGEGEYYWADLVGLAVINRQSMALGQVAAVQDFGAHPVLRVVADEGAVLLIPFVDAYIDGVDIGARRIDVDWQADF
ncbi:MAG: 16S rRNA processing protein RimM [Burkholderiales bacterium]|nr:16S rRNA processing protein RimM [Burkholderiales bacterium]